MQLPRGNGHKSVERKTTMLKLLKRLFKRQQPVVVYKGEKPRKFKSFEEAIAFMLMG